MRIHRNRICVVLFVVTLNQSNAFKQPNSIRPFSTECVRVEHLAHFLPASSPKWEIEPEESDILQIVFECLS
uniref:Putative secreted protein n=1 Tax=Anopheles triannulatus TaxID=58253 RepID=A0A2M4B885_9DIPT